MYRDDADVQQVVDGFLRQMPYSLERIYEKIPEEKIASYQRQSLVETIIQVREYFGGA